MKQAIGTMKPVTEPVDDLDVLFVAVYNLLYEKIQQEPNKGIVVSKGNPNQRKATWSEVMNIAHELEDYFTFRRLQTRTDICGECLHWKSVSEASPHMGECLKHKKRPIHRFSTCKKYEQRRNRD